MKYLVIIMTVMILSISVAYHATTETLSITVVDKERITQQDAEGKITSKFLVYAEEEVFENVDSLLFFKFASSDLQRDLREGETYNVYVVGWRIPFFSMYRNIIRIEE